jgi:two-component system NtrC family sensor kinase
VNEFMGMTMEEVKVLCVADDPNLMAALTRSLKQGIYQVATAESGEALALLQEGDCRMVVADFDLQVGDGVELLRRVSEIRPEVIRVLLGSYSNSGAVVEAVNCGQVNKFIPKPWNDEELQIAVASALQHQELRRENNQLNEELLIKNRELKGVKEKLEDLVEARTEALEIRNRVLQISQGVLDVLPVAVFGIDPDGMIVSCNEYARDLFPAGIMGPFGQDRYDVFSPELNVLVDSLEGKRSVGGEVALRAEQFRCEVRRLHETLTQGTVIALIPLAPL